MNRLATTFLVAALAGCGGSAESPDAVSTPERATAPASPTDIEVTDTLLTFDPATVKVEAWRTLPLGLGSASVEIVERENGLCTFTFTHEIEMGEKRWKVQVPTDSGSVEIRSRPDPAEVSTSFDLESAEFLGVGGGPPES